MCLHHANEPVQLVQALQVLVAHGSDGRDGGFVQTVCYARHGQSVEHGRPSRYCVHVIGEVGEAEELGEEQGGYDCDAGGGDGRLGYVDALARVDWAGGVGFCFCGGLEEHGLVGEVAGGGCYVSEFACLLFLDF